MKLSEILKRENNNLDLIRILAAILVIWNHSFALSPLTGVINRPIAGIAVPLFGFISGLVITNSVLNKKNSLTFLVSIFSRLWIPLVVAVLVCALIVGPIFSEHSIIVYFKEYFKDIYIYIYNNASFNINYKLPGVFINNRYPNTVNGSIWVIPLFFGSYLFILAIKLIGILKDNLQGAISVIIFMLFATICYLNKIPFVWYDHNSFCILISILFGCMLCCLRNKLQINTELLIGVLILYFLFKKTVIAYSFKLLVVFISSLWIAQQKCFLLLKPKINLSLGLFLYAFPVQQIFACIYTKSTPLFNFIWSTLVTFVVAFISYYFVERYCYKFADKIYKFIDKYELSI